MLIAFANNWKLCYSLFVSDAWRRLTKHSELVFAVFSSLSCLFSVSRHFSEIFVCCALVGSSTVACFFLSYLTSSSLPLFPCSFLSLLYLLAFMLVSSVASSFFGFRMHFADRISWHTILLGGNFKESTSWDLKMGDHLHMVFVLDLQDCARFLVKWNPINDLSTSTTEIFDVSYLSVLFFFGAQVKSGWQNFRFRPVLLTTMPRWLLLAATIASIHGAVEPFPTPPEQTDEQISVMDFL